MADATEQHHFKPPRPSRRVGAEGVKFREARKRASADVSTRQLLVGNGVGSLACIYTF
jgi:hypothetical protein